MVARRMLVVATLLLAAAALSWNGWDRADKERPSPDPFPAGDFYSCSLESDGAYLCQELFSPCFGDDCSPEDLPLCAMDDEAKSPCPEWPAPPTNGTGRLVLEPGRPVVVPGVDMWMNLTFQNPGPGTFTFRPPDGFCTWPLIRIGHNNPVSIWGRGSGVIDHHDYLDFISHGVCNHLFADRRLLPNATFHVEAVWNGSFPFWDHASVERGDMWRLGTYWASPGEWNVSYGLRGTYDSFSERHIWVERNEHNAVSGIDSAVCSFARIGTPSNVTLVPDRPSARLGERVTFWANYTLALPGPGCFIAIWHPNLSVTGVGGNRTLESSCDARNAGKTSDPMTLFRTSTGLVAGHVPFVWDGVHSWSSSRTGLGGPCDEVPVVPGAYALELRPRPSYLGMTAANATFEWLPA